MKKFFKHNKNNTFKTLKNIMKTLEQTLEK